MNPFAANEILANADLEQYDAVSIALASPDTIRSWSKGEVKNPETINYRTYRPEREGLFCEKIFGPTRDWECACGKYKRIKHKGVVCDRCGVEVTVSRVRRVRMGHIELAVPVSHIWFFKCTPSRIGLTLDMTSGALERVLYYEDYLVTDPGDTHLNYMQLLNEQEYQECRQRYGEDGFVAKMGAEAVRDCLRKVDLDKLMEQLEEEIDATKSKQNKKKITKRMKLCDGFIKSGTRPEWMVIDVLPVIPPDLRPLVPLDGGRFATSDLNDLYRRVINRNNRLRSLLQLKTPDVIIRNEKRMLQEAVDAVFDNGRHGRPVQGASNRPLKSLSDMLKGKTGRFRQNLLGKRVDYSGRSVIVVGPELKLWQCGLPKKMALTLFEPFIVNVIRKDEHANAPTVHAAKKLIERKDERVWHALEQVIKGKTVMLNRAPTLHRLSIQSFEPVLVEGEAIRLHPMVCTAFNADFDGDQMAVHLPLSIEAQLESRMMMLASNSIFSPASGKSIVTPTQDVALGVYYITAPSQDNKREGRLTAKKSLPIDPSEHLPLFNDEQEVRLAYDEGAVKMHDRIWFKNPDYHKDKAPKYGNTELKILETTVGRVFFNAIWPSEIGFVNRAVDKSFMGDLIWQCNYETGHDRTIETLDKLKDLGYEYAALSGSSIGLVDMIVPPEKKGIIDAAQKDVDSTNSDYRKGIIADSERHNKVCDIWANANNAVADVMYKAIEDNGKNPEINPVFMMVDSKARGSKQQIRQLAGMRGCMADPSGNIIEVPIKSNFREGLTVLEYFISAHGARKGLSDTALKTADAGYLTRKLVDVSQDVIITTEDCNTVNGIEVSAIFDGDKEVVPIEKRILGRTALNDIVNPVTKEVVVAASQEIDERACDAIKRLDIRSVWIRSGLTCEAEHGMCAKCYGRDLSTSREVEIGTAVGIIAAQSIGEPGTQLTMRTFHVGGTASTNVTANKHEAKGDGVVTYGDDIHVVRNKDGDYVVLNKNGNIYLKDSKGQLLDTFSPTLGAVLRIANEGKVRRGDVICHWDPFSVPVLADVTGEVEFHDFVQGVTYETQFDQNTGLSTMRILDTRENLHPQITVRPSEPGPNGSMEPHFFSIPTGAVVAVKRGDTVFAGQVLAKTPRQEVKTRDITGGLPRVSELFEARHPKDAADIAKIEGVIDFGPNERGKRILIVRDEDTGITEKHAIPMGKHVIVFKDDRVKKGQPLSEGPVAPQEVLEVSGPQELQRYLVEEVQGVYRTQGVEINDKHIEIIVRQMLRKVKITNPGDTEFVWGDRVTQRERDRINRQALEEGRVPAEAEPVLLGITKASLETDSFISAASFQDTTRVLTEAATTGREDKLRGFKENVILGHLIPGGTGFELHRKLKVEALGEEIYDPNDDKDAEELRSIKDDEPDDDDEDMTEKKI